MLTPRFKRNFGRFWRRLWRCQTHDDLAREQMLVLNKRIANSIKKEQNLCPHMQGSSPVSDFMGMLTSIVWHKLDRGGDIFGVCTNCLREFWPSDSDYKTWRKKPSGNTMSSGGNTEVVSDGRGRGASWGPPSTELDLLSDKEIEDLFEAVRKNYRTSLIKSESSN